MKINFNPAPNSSKRHRDPRQRIFGEEESGIVYTFSGRSAIALILEYLRGRGELSNKSDQFLVPEWMCNSVLALMHNYGFPTTTMNEKVRIILTYHQWGFPQKMDEIISLAKRQNAFVIEDCAHAFLSTYRGRRVGTIAESSIWSLPKFFGSVAGGALYSRDNELRLHAESAKRDRGLETSVYKGIVRFLKKPSVKNHRELVRDFALYDQLAFCPDSARRAAERELADKALEKRRVNFAALREAFWGKRERALIDDGDVLPYVVPLFLEAKNSMAASVLQEAGIESGVYHFDVNRNMLEPKWVECVPVPCHQGISQDQMSRIIDVIRRVA